MANQLRIGSLAAFINGEYYHIHSVKKYPRAPVHVWTGTEYRPLTEREQEWVNNGGLLKVCKRCGVLMCATHTAQHYCKDCKEIVMREHGRLNSLAPKKCRWCGATFITNNSKHLYCCSECEKANSKQACRQGGIHIKAPKKKHDPYAWLHSFDENIRANGGSPHYPRPKER